MSASVYGDLPTSQDVRQRMCDIAEVTKCPASLLLDGGNVINGTEEMVATNGVLDVGVDRERVHK